MLMGLMNNRMDTSKGGVVYFEAQVSSVFHHSFPGRHGF